MAFKGGKGMTNFEKIKAMSVEEMANILVNPCGCCNAYKYSNCDAEHCVVQIMKYLKSEVEEDG